MSHRTATQRKGELRGAFNKPEVSGLGKEIRSSPEKNPKIDRKWRGDGEQNKHENLESPALGNHWRRDSGW